MADKKISALTAASTPLAGTEVLPIVQSGSTVKVSVADLTSGRSVTTGNLGVAVTPNSWGAGWNAVQVKSGGAALWSDGGQRSFLSTNLYFDGSNRKYQTTGAGAEYAQASNGYHIWLTAASGTAGNNASTTQVMQLDSSGNLTANTGNFVVGTAGKGIDFSANGGDVLSQYDEGSWTVKLFDAAGGGNQSATTVTGYYTRVGNLVHCAFWGLNNISTAGMTAGNVLHIELPFTASATGSGTGSFASENITFNGRDNATPAVPVGYNRAILRAYGTGTSSASVLVSNVGASANIDYFSMTYRV